MLADPTGFMQMDKFRNDMNDERIEKKISFDYNIGKDKSGVNATPAIYVNGKQIDMSDNKKTFDDIINDIEKLIKENLKETDSSEQKTEEKK